MNPKNWSIRTKTTAMATLVAVAVAVLAVVLLHSGSRAEPPAAAVVPTPTPTPTPTLSITPSPVAATTPAKPKVPHEAVASAAPTRFEIKGPAFDIKANVCAMPYIRPLDPPGDQVHTVCWVRDTFGVAPSSKSKGTSYILGHAWSQANLVFNPMSEFAMKEVDEQHPTYENGVPIFPVKRLNGYKIVLQVPSGTLTYVVTRAYAVSKVQAANVHSLMAATTPNRVVLITCGVRNGADVEVNIIVYATLKSSVAAHHATPTPTASTSG
jgi:hypothetical protein